MDKKIREKLIDITGVELMPGEPAVSLNLIPQKRMLLGIKFIIPIKMAKTFEKSSPFSCW